ncbi:MULTISPECIES: response regulator [Undibacterium]|uniref:Response regulator n=1 Tax=Undibacterium parvum TaxID=401471 RepID=A0A3Q9BSE1_9BURK|nr:MULTISPECIES: response regulator [Undibacterium]AZP13300.1 response regulator [Undibacterium parvum]MCX7220054.1 response regulator [Burkholderiales bacterium]
MKQASYSNTPSLSGPIHVQRFAHTHRHFGASKSAQFQYQADSDISNCGTIDNDDDTIDFLDEESEQDTQVKLQEPWKILIADDDSSVHDTTLLALAGVRIHDRPLEFSHAYSAKEAHQVLLSNPDVALILLDVVMETVDAGLKLVGVIRNELARDDLRIILRTGQPGYAPEQHVNSEFAIDGYTTKSKLTRSVLISVLNDTLTGSSSNPGLAN